MVSVRTPGNRLLFAFNWILLNQKKMSSHPGWARRDPAVSPAPCPSELLLVCLVCLVVLQTRRPFPVPHARHAGSLSGPRTCRSLCLECLSSHLCLDLPGAGRAVGPVCHVRPVHLQTHNLEAQLGCLLGYRSQDRTQKRRGGSVTDNSAVCPIRCEV